MTTGALWQLGPFELTVRFWSSIGSQSRQSWEQIRPLSPSRYGKKSLWSRAGGAKKIMPCGARERRSDWATATRLTPISEGYPLWLAKLATPDSSFARSQFPHSPSRFTSTTRASFCNRGASSVSLYGNGAVSVRSDKDSEPETYGEGIKKEIQYRRTLYVPTIPFLKRSPPRGLRKDTENWRRRGRISSRRGTTEIVVEDCGNWQIFRWTVCRLGYSEGAAMALGSLSLHIGIWRGTVCVPNCQENAAFTCDPLRIGLLDVWSSPSSSVWNWFRIQKEIAIGFNLGATGRGQIHDYFSWRRVFKGPLKEKNWTNRE